MRFARRSLTIALVIFTAATSTARVADPMDRIREADLEALTREVITRHRVRAQDLRFEIVVDPGDYTCFVDPDRVDQIVSNLLDSTSAIFGGWG